MKVDRYFLRFDGEMEFIFNVLHDINQNDDKY